jgi:hypothetical protein|tara:strand:- start:6580 stop:6957 length:378 start_codon:yes stop_codon:yes gene_type:complete
MSNTTRIGGCTLTVRDFETLRSDAEQRDESIEVAMSRVLSEWAATQQRRDAYATTTVEQLQEMLPFERELSFRTRNALQKHGATTVLDLIEVARSGCEIHYFGKHCRTNLMQALDHFAPGWGRSQ